MVLNTSNEVIESLGGIKEVARALKIEEQRVRQWRGRKLPAQTYRALQDLLKAKGLYAPDTLWNMIHIGGR